MGATTFGIMTLSITTIKIMGLFATLSITTFSIMKLSIVCHYAECRDYLNVMLSVVMLCCENRP
jgi:hypothetical protein